MKQNQSERLFASMEYIDENMVESAATALAGKKKYGTQQWLRVLGGIAACVALVIAVCYLLPFLQRILYTPPTYESARYTAQDVADIFDMETDGVATNAYQKVYAPGSAMLQLPAYSQTEYLPVYRKKDRQPQKSELTDFMENCTPAFESISGISLNLGELVYEKNYDGSPLYHTANYSGEVYVKNDTTGNTLYRVTTDGDYIVAHLSRFEGLAINGTLLRFDDAAADQEIKDMLTDTIDYLNEMFGTQFDDVRISRYYHSNGPSSVSVQLYAEAEPEDLLDQYTSYEFFVQKNPSIVLEFNKGTNDEGEYQVCKAVSYYEPIVENGNFRIVANCKRISLEQAEALLANGYVFGGHTCDLCMAAQEEMELSDYDFVSMEYVFSYHEGEGMPFYTFYKYLTTNENGMECYAKTYVPAIEVSGLQEYFAAQTKEHDSGR